MPIVDVDNEAEAAPSLPSSFSDMRLKVGDQIHLEPPRRVAGGRATVTIIGWLEGQSVITTAPQNSAGRLAMQEGELVLLRAFTGKSAFAFRVAVLRVAYQPFNYLHLGFPEKIEGVAIRSSPRCWLRLPAQVNVGESEGCLGNILNIGTTGALIEVAEALQKEQNQIKLSFSFELHGVAVSLNLTAQVCGEKSVSNVDGVPLPQYGVEFQNLQPNDRLILGGLVWYRMYEHPRTVT